jgi:hypothetical protein
VSLHLVPVAFADACGFVAMWHRHHGPPQGMKFAVGTATRSGVLVGVAITGRPVARWLDDGATLEVTRVATDGTDNACSMLYAACWRAASALGYRRLITYTHTAYYGPVCGWPCDHLSCQRIRLGESGASLHAAGWHVVAERPPAAGWNRPSRPREDKGTEHIPRTLWDAA